MITKLGEARQEWQVALQAEAEKVKKVERTVTEDCRTQAATQARIVVQSMLSQELDSWRKELNVIGDRITNAPTPVLNSKGPRASGSEADEDERAPEPPGLAEAVRRLDDRLA